MADPFSFLIPPTSSRSTTGSKPRSSQRNNNNDSFDAFQGLVSFGGPAGASQKTDLTLAERAARAEQDRKPRINNEDTHMSFPVENSFWDKFDTASTSTHTSSKTSTANKDEWNLHWDAAQSSSSTGFKSQSQTAPAEELWDIDFISSGSSKSQNLPPASATRHADLLDSDDFSPLADFAGSAQPSTITRSNTPGSFDFGESDERYNDDADDILGDLAKPVEVVKKTATKEDPSQSMSRQPSRGTTLPLSRTSSPPPHVLGKLVEMGFSIPQSKKALAETSMDVDSAIDLLLRDTVDMPLEGSENSSNTTESRRRRPPSSSPHLSRPSQISSPIPNDTTQVFQEHADRIISQASSIGLNMFNKANALWKESREKVAKVYEEQRLGVSGKQEQPQARTRPRWMEDQVPDDRIRPPKDIAEPSAVPYKSPARHRVTRPLNATPPTLSTFDPSPPSSRTSPQPISTSLVSPSSPPPPAIERPLIEVSASNLALSNAAKAQGTEHFKLGRFAEAEISYSRALAALPESHLLRVPLYNNRALTRIKIGEYKSSIEDSSMVIRIVIGDLGSSWHPNRESRDGATLAQAVTKAYHRRAEASEGLEKWENAKADWETLNSLLWVEHSSKKDAVDGITRCKRMLSGNLSNSSRSVVAPKQTTRTAKSVTVTSAASTVVAGAALSRVRAANLAQEKEDQERHELKDTVDARLEAWRSGKEKNLRALIASLETILPSRFNWQKVGMSELVTNNQVKVRYMKAIARLHPDKLSASEISVEERMIANGVFGTLNEAWNSFK